MRFSIIIPVYNGDKHLADSVRKLCSQSFKDWECIIVEDGSTDNTAELADRLAGEDSRIHVIHKDNAGVSAARNRGLDEAKGEWIVWLDADDAYVDGALAKLAELTERHPDVQAFQFPYLTPTGAVVPKVYSECHGVYSGEEAFRLLYVDSATAGQHWQPWRYVYRADSKPRFRVGIIHEDMDVLPVHLRSLSKVCIVGEPLYVYTPAREGAVTASYTPRRVRDILKVTENTFGKGFDAMVSYNLWGYYHALKQFPEAERKELKRIFHEHREWLMAIEVPRRTAWLKRLYARFFV